MADPRQRQTSRPGVTPEQNEPVVDDPWRLNELVRRRRLRADARRPLGVNLVEGLALTEFLSSFTGVCRR